MRDMRESNPPRSRFLSLLSRLWKRSIGRAAPADELLIEPEIHELNLQT